MPRLVLLATLMLLVSQATREELKQVPRAIEGLDGGDQLLTKATDLAVVAPMPQLRTLTEGLVQGCVGNAVLTVEKVFKVGAAQEDGLVFGLLLLRGVHGPSASTVVERAAVQVAVLRQGRVVRDVHASMAVLEV